VKGPVAGICARLRAIGSVDRSVDSIYIDSQCCLRCGSSQPVSTGGPAVGRALKAGSGTLANGRTSSTVQSDLDCLRFMNSRAKRRVDKRGLGFDLAQDVTLSSCALCD